MMKHQSSLQAFFNNQIVGMVEVDVQGRYLYVNQRWLEMTGYSADEMMARDFRMLTHPDDLPTQEQLDAELIAGKRSSYRIKKRYFCKDGSILWCDLSVTGLYDRHRQLSGMVALAVDVTAQHKIEQQLRQTQELQETLLNATPDIICYKDGKGRWLLANQSDLKLFGFENIDYYGKTDAELVPFSTVHADALRQCHETDERCWESGRLTIEDEVIPTLDGETKVFEVIKAPLFHADGSRKALVVVGRDVTARRKEQEHILRLAAIVEQSGETIVMTDTNGTIEYVNPTFTQVTGYTQAEAIGQNPRILNAGLMDPAVYEELWKTISQGGVWRGRFINKKKNGDIYTENVNIFPVINGDGEITNYVAVKQDITEQLLIQEQYQHAQKMEAIGQLAGGIAHDFNNIMAIILGQVELTLRKSPLDVTLVKRLHEIKSAATRATKLTQELLGFARKQPHLAQTLNLNDAVTTQLTLLKNLLRKNIDLRWIAAAEDPQVSFDPDHLNQILTNLIINARDSIQKTGVITVKTENIVLDEAFCSTHQGIHPGHYLQLTITDTGDGMPPEVIKRIFDPFFTTKETGKGTGLGLSMVMGLVKQNHGYLIVESTPGEGSTFSLYFPRRQSPGDHRG